MGIQSKELKIWHEDSQSEPKSELEKKYMKKKKKKK